MQFISVRAVDVVEVLEHCLKKKTTTSLTTTYLFSYSSCFLLLPQADNVQLSENVPLVGAPGVYNYQGLALCCKLHSLPGK